jgi:hypothetical protein
MLQLNVDAAVFAALGRSGAAVVVRECTCDFVASTADSSPNVSNPELAEAMAILLCHGRRMRGWMALLWRLTFYQ